MKPLANSFSHINLNKKSDSLKEKKDWAKPRPLEEILKSEAKRVNSYDELVKT